jgi:hypothetical protein
MHLVDIENLAGGPYPDREAALEALREYAELADCGEGDLAFVAANRHLVSEIVFDLPFSARVRHAGIGRDGADRCLLEDARPEWLCRRFGRLVIGSGDHYFADLANDALRAGLDVVIVARRNAVARVFVDLGCDIRYLHDDGVAHLERAA